MQKTKKVLWVPILLALLLVIGLGCQTAQKTAKQAPAWQFHDIVDVKFVQQYVKMPKPKGVMLIDSRPKKAKFDKGYIPTAVSLPDSQFAKMTSLLPKDKNTLLVFYCQGPS